MKKGGYILLLLVIIVAFWQLVFLQNGIKWDFVDAFLPSRYFFSESVLNNQFPLWNPYLLYGTPIYADLVSVFNPEFWIIGNMFGYSNISLQFVFLAYIFVAGVSFFYFLKQFNSDYKISVGLSVAYMLSGFVIGNAQHVAFVCGYALIPFLMTNYYIFIRELNRRNFVKLSIALFVMIYCSYPAITVISAYFMLIVFIGYLVINRVDKNYLKKLFLYHSVLMVIVIAFSATLILAYFQLLPFLSRFNGLPIELAQKHPFSIKSILSFFTPLAVGNDPQYFQTDQSFSNGYFGIISFVFLLFVLTKKAVNKESYLILFFGIFSLLASFGNQFFLREFLYNYAPFMDRFQYPGIFRAFTIFCFLAFTGENIKESDFNLSDRKRLLLISGSIIVLIAVLVAWAIGNIDQFAYFKNTVSFTDELFAATRFDNIILQGVIQIAFLLIFVLLTLKIKNAKNYASAMLVLFIADGITATQLSAHYTVLSKASPVKFYEFLKSSPKGFPIPEMDAIDKNTDRNAANDFTWMNNNVFPKKLTFDGLVSFKMDGYKLLADNHPDLLEAIKKEPVIYFSDNIRENSSVSNFEPNTVFLETEVFNSLKAYDLRSSQNDSTEISKFSPTRIEIKTNTEFPQLLICQQNYYTGWKVFIDGNEKDLLKSNFTHMSVLVPPGKHIVSFEYHNRAIIYTFCFTTIIFLVLIGFSIKYFVAYNPNKKKQVIIILVSLVSAFVLLSGINRFLYNKNKLGLTPEITEKLGNWKKEYKNDIRILLSTKQKELIKSVEVDAVCFINEKTNVSELSDFLMDSESKYFAFAWQGGIVGDELFELIHSFYPTTIEFRKKNSSGIILAEKGTKEQSSQIIRDFEPDGSPGWTQNSARIKVDSLTGNHSYFYTENEEFGTSVEFPVGADLMEKSKITVLTDFVIENNLTEVLLVFTTDRGGKMQIYQVLDISKFAKFPDKWNRAVYEIQIKPEIQEGDIIKIYFWNKNKANFQVDNLTIKFSNLNN
ncbi:MAG TPA: hypothetical protein PLC80_04400 [Draconibacterium sp.]|nr:hypothetical protein [Draconibacterium sp.]